MSSLQGAYERSGRDGLIAQIQQSIAGRNFANNVYMLVDPSLAVLAGNLREWPPTTTAASGWIEFRASEALPNAANRPLVRAMLQTFPSGDRLLVGRDISDLDSFAVQIRAADNLGRRIVVCDCGGREHPRDAPDSGAD